MGRFTLIRERLLKYQMAATFYVEKFQRWRMKQALLLFITFGLYFFLGGCAGERTISGKLVYKNTGEPVKEMSLILDFPKSHPGFLVFFIYPKKNAFSGKTVTDGRGVFSITTRNKGILIIHPDVSANAEVTLKEAVDSVSAHFGNEDGKSNVILGSPWCSPGEQGRKEGPMGR